MKAKTGAIVAAAGVVLVAAVVLAVKYDDLFVTPKLIEDRRAWAVQQMRDPGTVQFRSEKIVERGWWLCGELNGKNAYGAYVGFKRFMSRAPDEAWIEGSGYAGKPDARSTAQIIEGLQAKNEILKERIDLNKHGANLPMPSDSQLEESAQQKLFEQRWKQNCT